MLALALILGLILVLAALDPPRPLPPGRDGPIQRLLRARV